MTYYHATVDGHTPVSVDKAALIDTALKAVVDDNSALAKLVRTDRDLRLADCDWTQLPDAPVDATAWAAYRQELRDVPNQADFPANVTWPQPPQP